MKDLICPFGATLAKDDFGCRQSAKIIRRGGTEIACMREDAHLRCTGLFQSLKDIALPAFEVEDDLLQVPHGVLVKIQFGGLLGLQRISNNPEPEKQGIRDINTLVESSIDKFITIDAIPFESLLEDITTYKLPRRRKR